MSRFIPAQARGKAFLAEVGVGTLGVAAVLPTRHAMLRLVGLAQQFVVPGSAAD